MSSIDDTFKSAVSDWVELKKQLTEARSDMKILNDREKQLKKIIQGKMKEMQIDTVNLREGKIRLKKSVKKPSINKNNIKDGLLLFFNNNEAQLEGALNAIQDNLPSKESESISLTGIKKKEE